MPKFVCSYAHDIACFADFVVEATNERAALRQIRQALRDGKFANVDATPCWENGSSNDRVFVQGVASEHSPDTPLAELIGEVSTPINTGASMRSRKKNWQEQRASFARRETEPKTVGPEE